MKVLIVKVSALGDIVHALPVLAYLHEACPGLTVDWLLETGFAPILEGHPLVNRTLHLDTRGWRKQGVRASVKGALHVISALRRERYDVVLDLQGNSKSGLFTWLSGAPKRFGFDKSQVREALNLLATNHKAIMAADCHYIGLRYLQIARTAFPAGPDVPLCGPLPVSGRAAETVASWLDCHGLHPGTFFVIHYGTTWETKKWPLEQWCELVSKMARQGRSLVLTWGSDDERRAAETMAHASQGRAVIWPRGSLPELVALLAAARLVIGADTGPVHIAAAVKTPTVSLFRVTDSERNGPPGEGHVRLQARMDCSPCLRKECERDHECGRSITVDAVFKAVFELLSAHPNDSGGPT